MNLRDVYVKPRLKIYEQEPQCRTLRMQNNLGDPTHSFFVALPYTQFYFFNSLVYTTFSNYPLESGVQTYFALLPNVYPNGHICHSHGKYANYEGSAHNFVHGFWQTKFLLYTNRADVAEWRAMQLLRKTPLGNYLGWQSETRKDPTFVLDFPWPQQFEPVLFTGKTLKDILDGKTTDH